MRADHRTNLWLLSITRRECRRAGTRQVPSFAADAWTAHDKGMLSVDQSNRLTFADPSTVDFYVHAHMLQPPEAAISQLLAKELRAATMLDLGVGGGRTTAYFAPRVQRYVGVDYVHEMVAACRNRFAHDGYDIQHGDARDLRAFSPQHFDVVMFSYNGLDYVGEDDRIRVLSQVHRVTKPGGCFWFSTHNLGRAPDLLGGSRRGFLRLIDAISAARMRANNPEHATWATRPFAMVRDGACSFRLVAYHIRADAQVRQLHRAGFTDVRIFGLKAGAELTVDEACAARDPWLTYLARRP